jgi:hypothetical protein
MGSPHEHKTGTSRNSSDASHPSAFCGSSLLLVQPSVWFISTVSSLVFINCKGYFFMATPLLKPSFFTFAFDFLELINVSSDLILPAWLLWSEHSSIRDA